MPFKGKNGRGTSPKNGEDPLNEDASVSAEDIKVEIEDIENSVHKIESENNICADDIKSLKDEVTALKDSNLRIMAEFDNFRKRSQKEKDQLQPMVISNVVQKILPFVDSFDRALQVETTDESYKAGFTMIYGQFSDALKDIGVTEIDALDKPFDPELHNAVLMVDDDTKKSGIVAEVLQKGYEYDGKVIRHAVVKVTN